MTTDPLIELALFWNRAKVSRGFYASCRKCGERHPVPLQAGSRGLCYRCRRIARGEATTEGHHLGKEGTPLPEREIDGNLHRIASDLQWVWKGRLSEGSCEAAAFDAVALVLAQLEHAAGQSIMTDPLVFSPSRIIAGLLADSLESVAATVASVDEMFVCVELARLARFVSAR